MMTWHVNPAGTTSVKATVPNPVEDRVMSEVRKSTVPVGEVAEMLKSAKVKVTLALRDSEPLTPLTVTVTLLALAKVHDKVEVPEGAATVGGVRVHAELSLVRAILPLNPFEEEIVILDVPAEPAMTLTLVGLAAMVKSMTTMLKAFEPGMWVESPG